MNVPMLQISSLLQGQPESDKCLLCEIEVRPVCSSMSCEWSSTFLHRFDWHVYLNPQHLPHRPKEAGGYPIIRCLRSCCKGWQQSHCSFKCLYAQPHFFFFLSSLLLSLRAAASLRLVIRLRWGYDMWNTKILAGLDETNVCPHSEGSFPRTFSSCCLNFCCLFPFTSHHKDLFNKFLRNKPHI